MTNNPNWRAVAVRDRMRVPETLDQLRNIKFEICHTNVRNDERLSTGEYAGDFALRYILSSLRQRRIKYKRSRKRSKRRQLNGNG